MLKLCRIFSWLYLLTPMVCLSQSTVVTATVTDPSGQIWVNGTISYQFQGNSQFYGQYQWNGTNIPSNYLVPTVIGLNSGGYTTFTIPTTRFITPAGSAWKITVCPNASFTCSSFSLPITGISEDISSSITTAISIAPVTAANIPKAYNDAEIQTTVNQGGFYYNTGANTSSQGLRIWNGFTWGSIFGIIPINSPLINYVINAGLQPGGDIGAKVNNAIASCNIRYLGTGGNLISSGCEIEVPNTSDGSQWIQTTTISMPSLSYAPIQLNFDGGASLYYTGTGWSIDMLNDINLLNTTINNPTITGTSSGAGGIRLGSGAGMNIYNSYITGFSNGYAIELNGSDSNNIIGGYLSADRAEIHFVGNSTSGYPPNANTISHVHVSGSMFSPFFGELMGANNVLRDNVIDPPNGSASTVCGFFDNSTLLVWSHNYCEGGITNTPTGLAYGLILQGNGTFLIEESQFGLTGVRATILLDNPGVVLASTASLIFERNFIGGGEQQVVDQTTDIGGGYFNNNQSVYSLLAPTLITKTGTRYAPIYSLASTAIAIPALRGLDQPEGKYQSTGNVNYSDPMFIGREPYGAGKYGIQINAIAAPPQGIQVRSNPGACSFIQQWGSNITFSALATLNCTGDLTVHSIIPTNGVTCSGIPTSNYAVTNGIVTHC